MSKPKQKSMAEATIDSVSGAIGVLWDWLGDPPKKANVEVDTEPSIFELMPATKIKVEPKPSDAIDTEGEDA